MNENFHEGDDRVADWPFYWSLRFPAMTELQAERVRELISVEFGEQATDLYNQVRNPTLWCEIVLNRTEQLTLIAAYRIALESGTLRESDARGVESMLHNNTEWIEWLDKRAAQS